MQARKRLQNRMSSQGSRVIKQAAQRERENKFAETEARIAELESKLANQNIEIEKLKRD